MAITLILSVCAVPALAADPDAPVADAATLSVIRNTAKSGTLTGSATDPATVASFEIVTNPAHGTISGAVTDGTFTYTPTKDYLGSDSFTFKVKDSDDRESAAATVTIEMTPDYLQYEDMVAHWGAEAAGKLALDDIIVGEQYQNLYYFRPDDTMTRGDFILMVNALVELKPDYDLTKNPFDDTAPRAILGAAISAQKAGIIQGTGAGSKVYLNHSVPITRIEVIKMINTALERYEPTSTNEISIIFNDMNKVPAWAVTQVNELARKGILKGDTGGNVNPTKTITRAEAAKFIFEAAAYIKDHPLLPENLSLRSRYFVTLPGDIK